MTLVAVALHPPTSQTMIGFDSSNGSPPNMNLPPIELLLSDARAYSLIKLSCFPTLSVQIASSSTTRAKFAASYREVVATTAAVGDITWTASPMSAALPARSQPRKSGPAEPIRNANFLVVS